MIELRARPHLQGLLDFLGRFLVRLRVSPTATTLTGLGITLVGSVLIGRGMILVGAIVALAGSALDGLDGAVARASNRVTDRGSFLDSVCDRISEVSVWIGLAVGLEQNGDASSRILILVLLSLGGALMIPYLRAKAESIGQDGKGGLMGRAERVILFSAGMIIPGLLQPMLWFMAVAAWVSVGWRFWVTLHKIDNEKSIAKADR